MSARPSTPSAAAMRSFAAGVVAREVVREAAIRLAEIGVTLAPLKGVLLAATVDPPGTVRQYSDADVLVRERDFARALAHLTDHGWTPQTAIANPSERAIVSPTLPLPLDVHQRLFAPGRYALTTDALLSRARLDESLFGAPVVVLDPYDVYAHLVGHAVNDHSDARATAVNRDLVLLSDAHRLDPRRCAAHLVQAGLGRASRYLLALVHEATGDSFARAVLELLPRDPVGAVLARAAREVIARAPPRAPIGAVPAHLLNRTLPAAVHAAVLAAVHHARARRERGRG